MKVLRTPETHFTDLPDFPFEPHCHRVTPQLRLHHVDEGPSDAPPVVLMLHGDPITRAGDARLAIEACGLQAGAQL